SSLHRPFPPVSSPLTLHDALPISQDGLPEFEAEETLHGQAIEGLADEVTSVSLLHGGSFVQDAPIIDRGEGRRHSLSTEVGTFPDRKSTRLNSSHVKISYAAFCL